MRANGIGVDRVDVPECRELSFPEAGEDDVEIEDEGMDDAAFIEEQEEGDEDVTDIIGDVEDEEET